LLIKVGKTRYIKLKKWSVASVEVLSKGMIAKSWGWVFDNKRGKYC